MKRILLITFLSVFIFFSFISPYIMTWFDLNHLWFVFRVIMLFWIIDFQNFLTFKNWIRNRDR